MNGEKKKKRYQAYNSKVGDAYTTRKGNLIIAFNIINGLGTSRQARLEQRRQWKDMGKKNLRK